MLLYLDDFGALRPPISRHQSTRSVANLDPKVLEYAHYPRGRVPGDALKLVVGGRFYGRVVEGVPDDDLCALLADLTTGVLTDGVRMVSLSGLLTQDWPTRMRPAEYFSSSARDQQLWDRVLYAVAWLSIPHVGAAP